MRLLECLSSQFGFSELAPKWFHSYISNRTQSVKINTSISQPKSLTCGVPQGSVLGPLLFIMYTSPLSKLISSYPNIHLHLYADDTMMRQSRHQASRYDVGDEMVLEVLDGCEFVHQSNKRVGVYLTSAQVITRLQLRTSTSIPIDTALTLILTLNLVFVVKICFLKE